MAKKKTYAGGRPRYTFLASSYYGKIDKFGVPEWIYDNKTGNLVKNKYWGKKKHPTAKLWNDACR